MTGFFLLATRGAMKRAVRTTGRPPPIERRPRIVPLSRLIGATPTRAAILRRGGGAGLRHFAIRGRRGGRAAPGPLGQRCAPPSPAAGPPAAPPADPPAPAHPLVRR